MRVHAVDGQWRASWVLGPGTLFPFVNVGYSSPHDACLAVEKLWGASRQYFDRWLESKNGGYFGQFAKGRRVYVRKGARGWYGLAYGGVKANTSIAQSNNDCVGFPGDCLAPNAFSSGSLSETRAGWTAGGGLEWMLAQNWTAKVEYLYYDLGSVTYGVGPLVTSGGTFGGGRRSCRHKFAIDYQVQRQHRAGRAELSIPLI